MKSVAAPSPDVRLVSLVFIGRNCRGHWVAQEQDGRYGGLFVDRAGAFKFALAENGRHPEAIVEMSCEIELVPGRQITP